MKYIRRKMSVSEKKISAIVTRGKKFYKNKLEAENKLSVLKTAKLNNGFKFSTKQTEVEEKCNQKHVGKTQGSKFVTEGKEWITSSKKSHAKLSSKKCKFKTVGNECTLETTVKETNHGLAILPVFERNTRNKQSLSDTKLRTSKASEGEKQLKYTAEQSKCQSTRKNKFGPMSEVTGLKTESTKRELRSITRVQKPKMAVKRKAANITGNKGLLKTEIKQNILNGKRQKLYSSSVFSSSNTQSIMPMLRKRKDQENICLLKVDTRRQNESNVPKIVKHEIVAEKIVPSSEIKQNTLRLIVKISREEEAIAAKMLKLKNAQEYIDKPKLKSQQNELVGRTKKMKHEVTKEMRCIENVPSKEYVSTNKSAEIKENASEILVKVKKPCLVQSHKLNFHEVSLNNNNHNIKDSYKSVKELEDFSNYKTDSLTSVNDNAVKNSEVHNILKSSVNSKSNFGDGKIEANLKVISKCSGSNPSTRPYATFKSFFKCRPKKLTHNVPENLSLNLPTVDKVKGCLTLDSNNVEYQKDTNYSTTESEKSDNTSDAQPESLDTATLSDLNRIFLGDYHEFENIIKSSYSSPKISGLENSLNEMEGNSTEVGMQAARTMPVSIQAARTRPDVWPTVKMADGPTDSSDHSLDDLLEPSDEISNSQLSAPKKDDKSVVNINRDIIKELSKLKQIKSPEYISQGLRIEKLLADPLFSNLPNTASQEIDAENDDDEEEDIYIIEEELHEQTEKGNKEVDEKEKEESDIDVVNDVSGPECSGLAGNRPRFGYYTLDPTIPECKYWSVREVAEYLREQGLPEDVVSTLIKGEVDGRTLLLLERNDVLLGYNLVLGKGLKLLHHVLMLQHRSRDPRLLYN